MTDEQKAEWKKQNEAHKDEFKAASGTKAAGEGDPVWEVCSHASMALGKAQSLDRVDMSNWPPRVRRALHNGLSHLHQAEDELQSAATTLDSMKLASDNEEKQSKFEEGKPADPTENMSDEDAKKWKVEHDKHKDNFKAAADAQTVKLDSSGEDVLAKKDKGELTAVTYANRSQANAAADKMGEGWEVIQRGRPWYLRKTKGKTAADMTSHYAFGMAASKMQMAVDAFAYAEDSQGYARGWSNLSKGMIILEEFFRGMLPIAATHLDRVGKLCQGKDLEVSAAGYLHLEEAQKELSRAADVARAGNIAQSFKKLAGTMEAMARMGQESHFAPFTKAVTDIGVIFRHHDASPFEGKTAAEATSEDKQSKFEEGKPADPTENMSDEDAKKWKVEHDKNKDNFKAAGGRTTHLEGKSGHTLCGEKAYKDTIVESVKDATCHYCVTAWEKKHGGLRAASQNPWKA